MYKQPLSHVQQQIQASEQGSTVAWPAHRANSISGQAAKARNFTDHLILTSSWDDLMFVLYHKTFTWSCCYSSQKRISLTNTHTHLEICKKIQSVREQNDCYTNFYTSGFLVTKQDQGYMSSTFHSQINYQILLNSMSLTLGEKKRKVA